MPVFKAWVADTPDSLKQAMDLDIGNMIIKPMESMNEDDTESFLRVMQ